MESSDKLGDIYWGFQKLLRIESSNQLLLSHIDKLASIPLKEWSTETVNNAVSSLCQLIRVPKCMDSIFLCFPHLAPSLVSQVLEKGIFNHQDRYVLLGKLFVAQKDLLQIFWHYFDDDLPPWVPPDLESSKKTKKPKLSTQPISDLDIVECCLNLLKVDFRRFNNKWCWSDFLNKYITSNEELVVWVALQCTAKILRMDETTKEEFFSKYLSSSKIEECILYYDAKESTKKWLNRWGPNSICDRKHELNKEKMPCLRVNSFVDVGGVLLPIHIKEHKPSDLLVPVKSTTSNLRRIAIGVSTGKAVCLIGPVGCGKSALVEQLANLTGRRTESELLKVQLGEETDSKLLLGTYKCTDVPGEFIWEAGILTKAVINGHWLLIEDIESAANDVAAVLANLLEHNSINVPGYRDNVQAAPGFHLFMTHRLLPGGQELHRKQTAATELLEKHWLLVNVEPLSTDELVIIIQTKFPALKTIATRMVAVYMLFSVGEHDGDSNAMRRQAGHRLISTRDLLKWCMRAEIGFEVTSPESALKVLQDAIDIFCSSYSDSNFRATIAGEVAVRLGIIKTKAEYFCNHYKPNFTFDTKCCKAGRAILPTLESNEPITLDVLSSNMKFAFTRESSCLLERLSVCLNLNEPVLLVGETGTGKTTAIQLLARHTRHKLVVINMNQQSDSSDLLGGYKPVDLKQAIVPLREEFESLFRALFNIHSNQKFLENISVCVSKRLWTTLLKMMAQSQKAALKRLHEDRGSSDVVTRWRDLGDKIHRLQAQLSINVSAMTFSFVEGSLVKALKEGHWVLLDEINLACAETLQCLSSLLEGAKGSISLLERGDSVTINRHPNFRLLAAMNPATDFGKKDLPPGLRNRFSELYVSEHLEKNDLFLVVKCYLPDLPPPKIESVVKFYLLVRKKAADVLVDSTGHRPVYSLRTLCRGLVIASENRCGNVSRSLYEALCLSFLTQLNASSHSLVKDMIAAFILDDETKKSVLTQKIPEPSCGKHVCFEGYWVLKGPNPPLIDDKYLLTPSVRKNLCDIARCVSLSNHPLLIQGETSVGKTSLVTYLAQAAGHKCYRINNHQHTDLQEYIGTYCVDPISGSLVFREGVLVEAMRMGHWIILDELNLAPSEVLEALNRVLDDNRELFIPETQVTVKAQQNFRLFATQNPPGLYGGRKMLSRAFRNRFVELHFDEIPSNELETIIQHRCNMPLSYCKKLVSVMSDLQVHRRGSATFAGKSGFITLRDLFRWGERYRLAQTSDPGKYYDWDQHIADEGYLVLAGRVRKSEEEEIIRTVLEKRVKRTVSDEKLFTLNNETSLVTKHILEKLVAPTLPSGFQHIVWTLNLRKTAVLVGKALEFCEPLLLVGETGCGKTSICQFIAKIQNQNLYSVNCHQHSESSDFLGGLRPVREKVENKGKLFEWSDGPLIKAMKGDGIFLADEISLADDSVLERLNSLLEPERQLMVSEKGNGEEMTIVATEKFRFVGTMNPGGDYGKKELSPALRNRLTEVWCEGPTQNVDMILIVEHNLNAGLSLGNQEDGSSGIGKALVQFLEWFKLTDLGRRIKVSVRDVLTWIGFINLVTSNDGNRHPIDVATSYINGACLTLLDGIGTAATSLENVDVLMEFKTSCIKFLLNQVNDAVGSQNLPSWDSLMNPELLLSHVTSTATLFGIHPFYINKNVPIGKDFIFEASTTCLNSFRLLRSLQIPNRAVLLEGSPGVGKTSIVIALARVTGNTVTRINLSEQTDVSDLFGADLPVEGAAGGTFAWRDGPFLKALKLGHWILLDELNLASQSVVEGLNSVLDHRGEIFVPELGKTFHIKSNTTRLFACQNPQRQGGARKGLPQSFLNRFTQVFMEPLSKEDLRVIMKASNPEIDSDIVEKMVEFTVEINLKAKNGSWSSFGGPWEWNLRDLNFWVKSFSAIGNQSTPGAFVKTIYVDRLRKYSERKEALDLYKEIFGSVYPLAIDTPPLVLTNQFLLMGEVTLDRNSSRGKECVVDLSSSHLVLRHQINTLRSLALCVKMNWLAILVGHSYCGKTSVLNALAQLVGKKLYTIPLSSATDTIDLLGGFEQSDIGRQLEALYQKINGIVVNVSRSNAINGNLENAQRLLEMWNDCNTHQKYDNDETFTLDKALIIIKKRIECLKRLLEALPNENSVESILYVKREVDYLSQRVDNHSPYDGGNFEWVDSVLVKCLEEGHWLVIDNVNLCSGAVLDRLNGLLEPNGHLILGERGVTPEGTEITIKPHKDFRIFFTMDPARGNISRAMRNRGVEIFMDRVSSTMENNGAVHGFTNFSANLDHVGLLNDIGFTNSTHALALLDIHTKLILQNTGYETFHIGHLLDAAFLAHQNWIRGQSLSSAIESAFKETYINAKTMSIEQKLKLSTALSDALSSLRNDLLVDITCFMDCFGDRLIMQTSRLDEASSLECVKLQGSLLHAIIALLEMVTHSNSLSKNLSSYSLTDFESLANIRVDADYKILEAIPYVVLAFYSFASWKDATLRNSWVCSLINSSSTTPVTKKIYEKIMQLSSLICETLKSELESSVLPWDLRYLSNIPRASGDYSQQNKLHALICYRLVQACNNQDDLPITKKVDWKSITILQYSRMIKKGLITDLSMNLPIVCEISTLFECLEKIIIRVFSSSKTQLTLDQCWKWLHSVTWQFRLLNVSKRRVFSIAHSSSSSLPPVNVESLTYLTQHYKWFRKHTLPMIVEFSSHDQTLNNDMNHLITLISTIDKAIDFGKIHLIPICRQLRLSMGQPSPMKSTEQCDLAKKLHRLEDNMEFWKPDVLSVESYMADAHFLSSTEGRHFRQKIINCSHLAFGNKAIAEETIDDSIISKKLPEAVSEKEWNALKVWPFVELIALKLNAAFRSQYSSTWDDNVNYSESENSSCSLKTSLLDWFNFSDSIPPSSVGILKACLEGEGDLKSNLSTITLHLTHHMHSSVALLYPFWYLEWKRDSNVEDLDALYKEKKEIVSLQDPLLAAFLSSFIDYLMLTSQSQSSLALKSHRDILGIVHQLKNMLWRNLPSLFSTTLDLCQNEEDYLRNSVSHIFRIFSTCLNVDANTDTVENICRELLNLNFDSGKIKGLGCSTFVDPVVDALRSLEQTFKSFQINARHTNEWWFNFGKCWSLLGFVQLMFYSNLDLIDPVHKEAMKRQYRLEELKELKTLLTVQEITRAIAGATGPWPLKEQYETKVNELEIQKDLQDGIAVRPYPSLYNKIAVELKNFMESLFARYKLKEIYSRLEDSHQNPDWSTRARNEVKSWLVSLKCFNFKLKNQYYPSYPDIVASVLLTLSQIIVGVETSLHSVDRNIAKRNEKAEPSVELILTRLLSITDIGATLELIDTCCSIRILNLLKKARDRTPEKRLRLQDKTKMSKMSMQLIRSLRNTYINESLPTYILRILEYIVVSWKDLQEESKIKLAQEQSIYVNKLTPIQLEEQEIQNEIHELFPVSRDDDFGDIEGPDKLEDVGLPLKPVEKESEAIIFRIEHVEEICDFHKDIVTYGVQTPWLYEDNGHLDSPLSSSLLNERVEVFGRLISGDGLKVCDDSLSSETICGFLVALTQSSAVTSPSLPQSTISDFYHDPNVEEATQCISLLTAILSRVEELLLEWPDHPTLKLIKEIILRISSFSITSPLSRFLTGLELLLTRLHEWEENAHDGVSLARHAATLTNQIISWRRLELTAWKGALISRRKLVAQKARKWWFHLYSLTASFLRDSSEIDISTDDLVKALQLFMESSSLGEFETRLQLLLTFHCHCLMLPHSERQIILVHVFWNINRFYKQFYQQVGSKITELSAPIEKKLKEFVKIARWNDINYWAVKAAVEKTHKTVHKHIKDFEKILMEPASLGMTKLTYGSYNIKQTSIKFINYITKTRPLESYVEDNEINEDIHLLHLESLLRKCRRNSKQIILECDYPKLMDTLRIYIQEWKEVGDLINQCEIDPTTPEEKKKATAKVLLQKKRRAIAELFKTFSVLGFSYRSGLLFYERSNTAFSLLPPIDVKVALRQLTSKSCDSDLVAAWGGTEDVFLCSIAQYAQLKKALEQSHKDLGPVTIEKIKGFAAHFTDCSRVTKEAICANTFNLYSLRSLLFQIDQIFDVDNQKCDSTSFYSNQTLLLNGLDDLVFVLKQFVLVLDACPEKANHLTDMKMLPAAFNFSSNGALVDSFKYDDVWTTTKLKVESLISSATKLTTDIRKTTQHRIFCQNSNSELAEAADIIINGDQIGCIKSGVDFLRTAADDLLKIISSFEGQVNGITSVNPLTQSLESLVKKISNVVQTCVLTDLSAGDESSTLVSQFTDNLNVLIRKTLFGIQYIYKSHVKKGKNEVDSNLADESQGNAALDDNHIKEKLLGNLSIDIGNFKIDEIICDLKALLFKVKEFDNSSLYNACLSALRNAYPILDQFLLLYQFILTQQVASLKVLSKTNALLLKTFTQFAKNGYNIPEDLLEDGEEGEGEGTKGGMGLGEGEGEKDVSDQIESLDQLEDAKKPDDYKKPEEHKDCQEEEKGIDMEEDIEGELQDIEKKEDDDEEENDDNDDDPDKEMGETEKGADALDKEVWGSDSEEEDDDDADMPEDQGNRGAEDTEKEMQAKEDETRDGKESNDDDEKRHEQKKPEINEMEEPEIDDDHTDPYHGNMPSSPEIPPFEIPDNPDIDEDDSGEDDNKEEENPLDIDKMKEKNEKEDEAAKEEESKENDDTNEQENEEVDGDDQPNDFPAPEVIKDDLDEEPAAENEDEEQKVEQKDDENPEENNEESSDAVQIDKPSNAQAEPSTVDKTPQDQVTSMETAQESNPQEKENSAQQGRDNEEGGAGGDERDDVENGGKKGATGRQQHKSTNESKDDQKRQRPGDSNVERSLGESREPVKKKLKTIDTSENTNDEKKDEDNQEAIEKDDQADLYQHIKEAKPKAHDTQIIDAATKEQAEKQPIINKEDEKPDSPLQENEITEMDEDDVPVESDAAKPDRDHNNDDDKMARKNNTKGTKDGDVVENMEVEIEVEGEVVPTLTVPRGPDSSFHTQKEQLTQDLTQYALLPEEEVYKMRKELQDQLSSWNQPPVCEKASDVWEKLSTLTSVLSRDLSEQLRLVLEPTTVSGLKGDFRTGRRINMRKVIPYIASQFRKDKIWLRRSKPSKREYQIVIAIDDSSSMADNQSKELAFESLALVSRALNLLEAGDLAVLSFGETVKVLHELGQPFTDQSGTRLVQQLTFEQKRTKVGALVDFTTVLLSSCAKKTDADVAQLLVILSDGRGVMSEGEASILAAVRNAKHNRIFMIFVVIESPNSKDCILDIRQPCFKDGKLLGITSYMDNFPFPFYIILRDISTLPSVLSDALRQWFELVTNSQ